MERKQIIVRASIIGIIANIFLAGFKAVIGLLSNSIAIVLDAVNNLSDALSSVITIVGTRIAGRKPDKEHPFGHGRAEYLTAAIIAIIVLYAGVTSLVESVKKIINPVTPDYGPAALIIVAAAILVKLALSVYVKKTGERVSSDALLASGQDARNDAVISAATLAAAGIYLIWQLSVEAILGAVISLVILKSGFDMLRQTISRILGERIDTELARSVKAVIQGFEDVSGAYDLILHNYGPDLLMGSVHIEVPDYYTADRLDSLEREIVQKVMEETGVVLTGVSVYSVNTTDDEAAHIREDIRRRVMMKDHVLQMHGFYMTADTIQFDVIIGFEAPDRHAVWQQIESELQERYPGYRIRVTMDNDMSD
ncbi:MAG: cation transporter [Oscillospiraceae bacterium]|nr:cation transporter [Oscillospiraceae bacterium]